MASVTSSPSERAANAVAGNMATVASSGGSRLSSLGAHTLNFFIHGFNATADVVGAIDSAAIGTVKAIYHTPQFLVDSTAAGIKWLLTTPTPQTTIQTTTMAKGSLPKGGGKAVGATATGSSKIKQVTSVQQASPIIQDPDSTYKWNLPPHRWSLPVDPSDVSDTVTAPSKDLHTTRRGLIFVGRKYVGATTIVDPATGKPKQNGLGVYQANYGFQFVWNPETFTQNTQVNWGVTPTQNDSTSGLTGLVAANSTISFTLRLDRTNDFASAKALYASGPYNNANARENRTTNTPVNFDSYYTEGQAPGSAADFAANMGEKISDLLKRGTEADLEFLYRAINGDGFSYLGVDTSNISYLMPTIVRLDLGPQRLVGMVQSINVTHLAFTRDMIPIRTDVAISIDLKANTQYANSNTQATGAAPTNVPSGTNP